MTRILGAVRISAGRTSKQVNRCQEQQPEAAQRSWHDLGCPTSRTFCDSGWHSSWGRNLNKESKMVLEWDEVLKIKTFFLCVCVWSCKVTNGCCKIGTLRAVSRHFVRKESRALFANDIYCLSHIFSSLFHMVFRVRKNFFLWIRKECWKWFKHIREF